MKSESGFSFAIASQPFNYVAAQWAIERQILASNKSVLLVFAPMASFVRIFLVWMFREFLQQLKNSLPQPRSLCDRNSCIILPATWHLTFRVCFLVCHSCSWFDSCSWYILMWFMWIVNFHECVLTAAFFFADDSSYTACTGVQRYFCMVEVSPGISHDSMPPV